MIQCLIAILVLVLLAPQSVAFLRAANERRTSVDPNPKRWEGVTPQITPTRGSSVAKKRNRRPLNYWDDLRESNTGTFETQNGSAVYRVTLDTNETHVRLAHVVSIIPFSERLANGTRRLIDSFGHGGSSVILAIQHFNERSSLIVPNLDKILGDCNVYLTTDIRDTQLSPIVASKTVLEYFGRSHDDLSLPFPVALCGATRSAVTEPLSVLAGVYETTVVNGQSTSSSLDNKDMFPTFTRTLPTNRVDSKAVVAYFKSLGVTHFGVLFIRDPYGSEYNRDLMSEANNENMTVISAAWDDGDEGSIVSALEELRDTEFRYFFAILAPAIDMHKLVIRNAIKLELMGTEHLWLYSEASNILLEDSFYTSILNSSDASDRAIASALNGAGLVVLEIPPSKAFDQAIRNVGANKELYDYYVSRFEAPELFDSLDWNPVPNFYQYATYDALISLGIGLCSLEQEFPVGGDIVRAVKNTKFMGSSGAVSYDNRTGTRAAGSVKAKVINFLVDTSGSTIKPDLRTSAYVNVSSQEVEVLSRFLYADGTAEPPQALPVLTVDLNLISIWSRALGWIVAGIIIVISIFFGWQTYRYRNKNIVRLGQPVFLGLLCVGAILMASTIIPMSFQEPMSEDTLNRGCITIPWLFVIGFATAFSSLFCKLRRLNKVFRDSASMRHAEVRVKDVMLPFVILFVANFIVLQTWTLVSPLQWTRVKVDNFDRFGRVVETYGTCFGPSKSSSRTAFLVTLGVFNFVAVALANYECYQSRHAPSDFNESYYISLSMLSILESFLLGIPILCLTIGKPTAQYVVSSVIIFLLCMSILITTFGSKLFVKKESSRLRTSEWRRAWRNYDETASRRRTIIGSAGTSASRDFTHKRRSISGSNMHLSSVAAIRARVAEQARQEAALASGSVQECQR